MIGKVGRYGAQPTVVDQMAGFLLCLEMRKKSMFSFAMDSKVVQYYSVEKIYHQQRKS